tara:strand:+ start:17451 stop:20342 length:2892 start_codon:yes stop_codon:yes gene_type:complete
MNPRNPFLAFCSLLVAGISISILKAEEPISISGVYPHLTMRNLEGECGTGAIVPWQGSLWAITYAPHAPKGSSDKLYEIGEDLTQTIFEGSVGGTPANRLIHQESNQLLIGPYLIDAEKNIRVIPSTQMLGRLTGNARHLTDPENKVYYATMEEGLYEVDVHSLGVKNLILDGHAAKGSEGIASTLPGYHGKGLYSGQGRLMYSNNGEVGTAAKTDPTSSSGALAQWFGEGDWQLVRRNQFTELTGPGGIEGNANPEKDPVWAMGWDSRSLLLGLLEGGEWHFYRLPKASHSYDGAHGWNTEWPRIREIGEDDLLATMHGTFWRFPVEFSRENSAGIAPRSNYLKVIGDFCKWGDRLVLGCDDSAKSEFLNTRHFKAAHASPKQSNSNLWFIDAAQLDAFGPAIGRGSVWLREDLEAQQTSDPFLFSGYDFRQIHLTHQSESAVTFQLEVDRAGNNDWETLREITVPANGVESVVFSESEAGAWIRLTSQQAAKAVTANFQFRDRDERDNENAAEFAGIATPDEPAKSFGLMRSLAFDRLGLVAASSPDGSDAAYYELSQKMELVSVDEPAAISEIVSAVRQPLRSVQVDAASVIVEEDGQRYRLPKNERYQASVQGEPRKTLADFLSESLAIGAAVTASSTHLTYDAANAVDGSVAEDDRWISQNTEIASIELDLGEQKSFRSLWVVSGWNDDPQYAMSDFDVEIRNGGEWQLVPGGEVRGNSSVKRRLLFDEPVSAQHLRISAKKTGYSRVYEIALFEQVLEIAPPTDGFGVARICREVATERDLLNLHGSFYELPARNAQGLAKIRPISTHNLAIHDFCSHNGLLLFTGLDDDTKSEHVFRSADGKAAIWAGVVDDLWKLGKPRGSGGPWFDSEVEADVPSDPYLMTAYDQKSVELSSRSNAQIQLEVDIDGTGLWIPYRSFALEAGKSIQHTFPEGFSAYWVRAVSDSATTATVQFRYD